MAENDIAPASVNVPLEWMADLRAALRREDEADRTCPARADDLGRRECPKCLSRPNQSCTPVDTASFQVAAAARNLVDAIEAEIARLNQGDI